MKQIMELLPARYFLQIHRSYIINTSHIQAIEGNQILIETHRIPISRNLKDEVMKRILG